MIIFDVCVTYESGRPVHVQHEAANLNDLIRLLREEAIANGERFKRIFHFNDIRLKEPHHEPTQ